jgi:hypothetical protein
MAEWSINQSDATYLKYMPHIASVELKKSRSTIDPLLQLAIWNSALFAQLDRLRRPGAGAMEDGNDMMSMPIPSLAIEGHKWEVYYTYVVQDSENGEDSAGGQTRVRVPLIHKDLT